MRAYSVEDMVDQLNKKVDAMQSDINDIKSILLGNKINPATLNNKNTLALKTCKVTAGSLFVRRTPDAEDKENIIRSIHKDNIVKVYQELTNGWCRIHPTNNEWVNGNFLVQFKS